MTGPAQKVKDVRTSGGGGASSDARCRKWTQFADVAAAHKPSALLLRRSSAARKRIRRARPPRYASAAAAARVLAPAEPGEAVQSGAILRLCAGALLGLLQAPAGGACARARARCSHLRCEGLALRRDARCGAVLAHSCACTPSPNLARRASAGFGATWRAVPRRLARRAGYPHCMEAARGARARWCVV